MPEYSDVVRFESKTIASLFSPTSDHGQAKEQTKKSRIVFNIGQPVLAGKKSDSRKEQQ